jgi:hypothetical protein
MVRSRVDVSTPQDRLNRYLDHLAQIFEREPLFHPLDSEIPGAPKVVCMTYHDVPEAGHITGVTYGLSEVPHDDWRFGRPELLIAVQSTDISWPLAIAEMANRLRGRCPFSYGDVINFGEKVADDSDMSAFFVFAPSILEKGDYLDIDVGGPQRINIAGMYPIYDSERAVIRERGIERFWHHPNFDLYDVRRPMVPNALPS